MLCRRHPGRVRLWNLDRLLMVWLYRLHPALLDAILIVQPETVIHWHRRGFRAYWRWQSRHVGSRPRIEAEIRALIRRASTGAAVAGNDDSAIEGQTKTSIFSNIIWN